MMQQPQQSQQQQIHQRGTPGGRRRQNRHTAQSPANRTYASENDLTDTPFPMDLNGPQTPRKSASNSPVPTSLSGHPKSKSRNNRHRPANVSTSPNPPKNGHHHSPPSTMPKSAAASAFAGSTFHASPAPSSLPIPSFLAKSFDSPRFKDKEASQVKQEPSPPATDSETATPRRPPHMTQPLREESPLDLFFRADRAEKEQARRASSGNVLTGVGAPAGTFSPPSHPQFSRELRTIPNGAATEPVHRVTSLRPSAGIATAELDSSPDKPMGPAFSTPYQDRIRAARTSDKPQPSLLQQTVIANDRSDALKRFLAIGTASPSQQPSRAAMCSVQPAFAPANQSAGATVTRVQQISVSSETTVGHGSRTSDLMHMENSLRQILKLDSALNLGPSTSAANYRG